MEERVIDLEKRMQHLTRVVSGDGTAINLGVLGVLENHTTVITDHGNQLRSLQTTIDRFRWSLLGYAAGGAIGGGVLIGLLGRALGWPS